MCEFRGRRSQLFAGSLKTLQWRDSSRANTFEPFSELLRLSSWILSGRFATRSTRFTSISPIGPMVASERGSLPERRTILTKEEEPERMHEYWPFKFRRVPNPFSEKLTLIGARAPWTHCARSGFRFTSIIHPPCSRKCSQRYSFRFSSFSHFSSAIRSTFSKGSLHKLCLSKCRKC